MSVVIKTLILINTPEVKPSQSSFLLGELHASIGKTVSSESACVGACSLPGSLTPRRALAMIPNFAGSRLPKTQPRLETAGCQFQISYRYRVNA